MKTILTEESLSTEQSIKIISQTIENTRKTITKRAGKPLILWGILVALTAILIYVLVNQTSNQLWHLLWFAMSFVGFIGTIYISKGVEHAPSNMIENMLKKIWMWFGIVATGFYLLIWLSYLIIKYFDLGIILNINLTLIIAILMGLAGIISGEVIKMRSIVICNVFATFISILIALLCRGNILVFVVLGVVGLLVPGLILQRKVN